MNNPDLLNLDDSAILVEAAKASVRLQEAFDELQRRHPELPIFEFKSKMMEDSIKSMQETDHLLRISKGIQKEQ